LPSDRRELQNQYNHNALIDEIPTNPFASSYTSGGDVILTRYDSMPDDENNSSRSQHSQDSNMNSSGGARLRYSAKSSQVLQQ